MLMMTLLINYYTLDFRKMIIFNKNNLDSSIPLVNEFMNILSDFKRFNDGNHNNSQTSSSPRNDDVGTRDTSGEDRGVRADKRLEVHDARDTDDNLFAEYIGSYTVKKDIAERKPTQMSKRRPRSRKRNPRKGKLFEETDESRTVESIKLSHYELPTVPEEPDFDQTHMSDEGEETFDSTKQSELLNDFLVENNFFTTEDGQQEIKNAQEKIDSDDVKEEVTDDESQEAAAVEVFEDGVSVDDNNNPIINIIDIINSDDEIINISTSNTSYDDDDIIVNVSSNSNEESASEESSDIDGEVGCVAHSYKHPLQHCWSFWYFYPRTGEWSENLQLLSTVETVEDFWSVYNWIDEPSRLKTSSDLSLFREGVPPDWSDPANEAGGRYMIKCSKEETDFYWREILMSFVGDTFVDEDTMDQVRVNKFTFLLIKNILI